MDKVGFKRKIFWLLSTMLPAAALYALRVNRVPESDTYRNILRKNLQLLSGYCIVYRGARWLEAEEDLRKNPMIWAKYCIAFRCMTEYHRDWKFREVKRKIFGIRARAPIIWRIGWALDCYRRQQYSRRLGAAHEEALFVKEQRPILTDQ